MSLSPVLYLLLYPGAGVMFCVPEDQLRVEDGGDAGCCGDIQCHYPPDARPAAGRLQHSAVPHADTG